MKIRRARDPSLGIETLNLYSLLNAVGPNDAILGDEQDRATFLKLIEQGFEESLTNQRRLHGRWAQDLFEAVAVSLDSIRLIKEEDSGGFFFDHSRAPLHLPDFRIVLNDGRQILVEVKNVAPSRLRRRQKLRTSLVEAEREYARLTGAELYLAHFWAWNKRWTLVNSSILSDSGDFKVLDFEAAMKQNEMAILGDFFVGTSSLELILSLVTDPNAPQLVVHHSDGTESVRVTLVRDEIYCEDTLLTDDVERRIARSFMLFGGLDVREKISKNSDGSIKTFDYIFSPFGEGATSHLAPISGMFSVKYIVATKAEDGSITKIRHGADANLAQLIPDEYWFATQHTLVIQKFVQEPLTPGTGP